MSLLPSTCIHFAGLMPRALFVVAPRSMRSQTSCSTATVSIFSAMPTAEMEIAIDAAWCGPSATPLPEVSPLLMVKS